MAARRQLGQHILAFVIIFTLEWWLNDFISVVCCNRSNAEFTQRIRNQLFAAIMRQDTVYFELNDSGAVCERLNSDCGRVAESFLHLPRDMLGIASRVVATGCLMWIPCPQMLYRALLFAVLAAPFVVVMQRAARQRPRAQGPSRDACLGTHDQRDAEKPVYCERVCSRGAGVGGIRTHADEPLA
jgi:ABC-type multidrug transport system fused ATPase/permease subunit